MPSQRWWTDVAADMLTATTPGKATAAADRFSEIAERERASRGDRPRAVDWADALTAAASGIADLPR